MVKSKFLVIFFYLILINNTIGLENKIILKIDNKIITTLIGKWIFSCFEPIHTKYRKK